MVPGRPLSLGSRCIAARLLVCSVATCLPQHIRNYMGGGDFQNSSAVLVVSHSAPIGRQGCPFGSQLCPIQHPPGCMEAIFDVPQKMTQNKNACFLGFCRPKILGREKSEPRDNHCCVLLGFRRSRGNKKSRHVPRLPTCPALLGFVGTNGARMGRVRCP